MELGLAGAWTQQAPRGPCFPASLHLPLQGANWDWRLWTRGALIWNLDLEPFQEVLFWETDLLSPLCLSRGHPKLVPRSPG